MGFDPKSKECLRGAFFGLTGVMATIAVPAAAWAAYSIGFEAELRDAKPVKGSVVVNEGQAATIEVGDTRIELVPASAGGDAVRIDAEIFRRNPAGFESIAKPALITRSGNPAEISQKRKDGARAFRLKVTPKKI
jgi:hypothetical protein